MVELSSYCCHCYSCGSLLLWDKCCLTDIEILFVSHQMVELSSYLKSEWLPLPPSFHYKDISSSHLELKMWEHILNLMTNRMNKEAFDERKQGDEKGNKLEEAFLLPTPLSTIHLVGHVGRLRYRIEQLRIIHALKYRFGVLGSSLFYDLKHKQHCQRHNGILFKKL